MTDDRPTDAPGDDCADHGPYTDETCPKCKSDESCCVLAQRIMESLRGIYAT